jgi:hypothetical protein
MPSAITASLSGVRAHIRRATVLEGCLLHGLGLEDERVVTFWHRDQPDWPMVLASLNTYYPWLDDTVLLEFLRVFAAPRVPDDSEIIRFYERYGPLDPRGFLDRFYPPNARGERDTLPEETLAHLAEPIWWVRACALKLMKAYQLCAYLRRGNPRLLKQHLGRVPRRGLITDAKIGDGGALTWWIPETQLLDDGRAPMARRVLSDDDAMHWARWAVLRELNAIEERIHRYWVPARLLADTPFFGPRPPSDDRPEPVLGAYRVVRGLPLCQVLWLQLGEKAEAGAHLGNCPECHRPFAGKRSDQEYCSSSCRDRFRNRRYYNAYTKPNREARKLHANP